MAAWYRRDPAFSERVRAETLEAYPRLTFELRGGKAWVGGPYLILDDRGVELARYQIAVRLPDDFPETIPDLFEVGGRIERTAEEHTYASGRACLFVPGERWRHWPPGSTLVDFLDGPVRSHLTGHAHFVVTGEWPWGERSHGAEGIFESYEETLGTADRAAIVRFLCLLGHAQPKGHWACPCGSGEKLRKCHAELVSKMRELVTCEEAGMALASIAVDVRATGR